MQHIGYLFAAIAAFIAIFLIASPNRFFKAPGKRKKIVGPSYWGNYYNNPNPEDEKLSMH